MDAATVETFFGDGAWRNRVSGQGTLPGAYLRRETAVIAGRDEARWRGGEHVIRDADGRIVERSDHGRAAHPALAQDYAAGDHVLA